MFSFALALALAPQLPGRPAARCGRAAVRMAVDGRQRTPTGLGFRDLAVGDGAAPQAGDRVAVQYTARISSGELSDTVYDTTRGTRADGADAEPFVFKLGKRRVVPGWDEGVASMRIGGRRTLSIPNALAYGGKAYSGNRARVPPGSDLEVDVELVGIYGGVDYSWTKNVFTINNAGPFAVLIVIGVFQSIAGRDDLPPWLVELIPRVLGSQYQRPY